MRKQEKEAIINGLLSANVISIILSILMWAIYRGYMHTAYILSMPKIVITIGIIGIINTVILSWRLYNKLKQKKKSSVPYTHKGKRKDSFNRDLIYKYVHYIVISIIIAIGCILIYPYNIIYIYGIWIFIALYLLVNIFYSVYLFKIKR